MTFVFNTHNEKVLENCIKQLRTDGLNKEVKIGPIRKSRNQEAYAHALWKVIADHIGEDPEETKMRIKYAVLPLKEIRTGDGKTYLYPESTVNQPKEVYSKLIEATLMLGAQLGLTMPDASLFGLEQTEKQ